MSDRFDIAVLATGSELLSGELSDTNTTAIASLLAEQGFALRRSLVVSDNNEDIVEALQFLAKQHQAVIVTGGLGPTEDDLTAAAAAQACELQLRENQQAADLVAAHFRRLGRAMPKKNRKQALLPEGCRVLPNSCGTAPGFSLKLQRSKLFFLPGVPVEMTAMLAQQVLPELFELAGPRPARQECHLQIFGLSEPAVEERLQALDLPPQVEIGYGVRFPQVIVKLRCHESQALQQARKMVAVALADVLVNSDDRPPEQVTAELLIQSGLTLALAESCTGGMIAMRLTEIAGASAFLERGAVSYANNAKRDWLKVPQKTLDELGAVSEECARAMAQGVRAAANADLGLAVTGIAGPGGGTPEKPVGTVYLALADASQTRVERLQLGGSRRRIRELTTATALAWLRKRARQHPQEP